MAENESLDLSSPQAKRWFPLLDAVRKGSSVQKAGMIASNKLSKAIRTVLRQFEGYKVTTADFFANRTSPTQLSELIRQTKGHPYAQLLVSVLNSSPGVPQDECLLRWERAVLDKVFDQISHKVAGAELFPSFSDTAVFFENVRIEIRPHLETMATKLAGDPCWKPSVRHKRGEPKTDATAELMSMSLV